MSVLVVIKVPGDTTIFESFMAQGADRVIELTAKAKAAGCRSHKFGVGEGEIVVVDEWDSREQFVGFFSSPDIVAVMGEMGAQGEPQITFADATGFPGEF